MKKIVIGACCAIMAVAAMPTGARGAWDQICTDVDCSAAVDGTFFPSDIDCRVYYECEAGRAFVMACPEPTIFCPDTATCDWVSSCPSATEYCEIQSDDIPVGIEGLECGGDSGGDSGGGGTSCTGAQCLRRNNSPSSVAIDGGTRTTTQWEMYCSKAGCCSDCSGSGTAYSCSCNGGWIVENQDSAYCSCAQCEIGTYQSGNSCLDCPLMGANGESLELGMYPYTEIEGSSSIYDCVAYPYSAQGQPYYTDKSGKFEFTDFCHYTD